MSNEILSRDQNHVPVVGGVTDNVAAEIRALRIDPATGRVLLSLPAGAETIKYLVASSTAPAATQALADYVCDGVDDDVQINAAIAALPAAGGKVMLTEGTYNLSATITIAGNQALIGTGFGTILKPKTAFNSTVIIAGAATGTSYGVVLKGMYIDGNQSNQSSGNGIKMIGCYNAVVENVWVRYAKEKGLWLTGNGGQPYTAYCGFYESSFTDGYGTNAVGVYLDNASEFNSFRSCNFDWHSGNQGIGLYINSGNNYFEACQLDANGYNLYIAGNVHNKFVACSFDRATYREIWITGGAQHNIFNICQFGYYTFKPTLATGITSGATITSLVLNSPIPQDIPTWGVSIVVDYGSGSAETFTVTSAGASAGATTIPVNSKVATGDHSVGAYAIQRYRGVDHQGGSGPNFYTNCIFGGSESLAQNNINWDKQLGEDSGTTSVLDGNIFNSGNGVSLQPTSIFSFTNVLGVLIADNPTYLAVKDGGTGAATAATARTNLGAQAKTYVTVGTSNADYITDGVADEVQIQQAIDSLTGGRTSVEGVILKGSFVVGAPIVVPSYTHIHLEGKITVDAAWTSASVNTGVFVVGTLNAVITNVEIEGGAYYSGYFTTFPTASGANNRINAIYSLATIKNSSFHNFYAENIFDALFFEKLGGNNGTPSTNVQIHDIRVKDVVVGVQTYCNGYLYNNFQIYNIEGINSTDDMVALAGGYGGVGGATGAVDNVTISNVTGQKNGSAGAFIKIDPGTNATGKCPFTNISVSNIIGTTTGTNEGFIDFFSGSNVASVGFNVVNVQCTGTWDKGIWLQTSGNKISVNSFHLESLYGIFLQMAAAPTSTQSVILTNGFIDSRTAVTEGSGILFSGGTGAQGLQNLRVRNVAIANKSIPINEGSTLPTGSQGTYTNFDYDVDIMGSAVTDCAFSSNPLRAKIYKFGVYQSAVSMADATSFTPNINTPDINIQTCTQTAGTLTANAPSGTPTDGQTLILRVKCTNVQTWSWNAIYRSSNDIVLPTATTGSSKTDYIGFRYNSTDTKWDVVAKSLGY